jgi:hypothetical protein
LCSVRDFNPVFSQLVPKLIKCLFAARANAYVPLTRRA